MRSRLLALAAIGLLAATPALGQRNGATDGAGDVGRLQAEHRDEQVRARRLRADARQAAAEVERLRRELIQLARDQGQDEQVMAEQRARLNQLNAREAALLVQLNDERGRLSRLLSALQLLRRDPPPALLVAPERATDAVRAAILMRAVTPGLRERAALLAERQDEIARLRRDAALSSERLFTTESSVLDRRSRIETLVAEKAALETVLNAEAGRAEAAARALADRIRDLGGMVRALEAGSPSPATSASLPGGRTRLTPPVTGSVERRFGRGSSGWTWRAEPRAVVVAPADATVDYAGPLEGWDQIVILRLGSGWRVVLAGLGAVSATTGTQVAEGEPLGRLGAGEAGRAALYFELRREEIAVNPARWLDAGPVD